MHVAVLLVSGLPVAWPRNETRFEKVAMAKFPPPKATRLWVSDGTAEGGIMGGDAAVPGSIPFTVAAMRRAGLSDFPFVQNLGMQHNEETAWLRSTLWQTLAAITPRLQIL